MQSLANVGTFAVGWGALARPEFGGLIATERDKVMHALHHLGLKRPEHAIVTEAAALPNSRLPVCGTPSYAQSGRAHDLFDSLVGQLNSFLRDTDVSDELRRAQRRRLPRWSARCPPVGAAPSGVPSAVQRHRAAPLRSCEYSCRGSLRTLVSMVGFSAMTPGRVACDRACHLSSTLTSDLYKTYML